MYPIEFLASILSVAPSALLDYAVIAMALKLPLRLRFAWIVRGFPAALVLMAALHTWQQPIGLSGLICVGVVCAMRGAQAGVEAATGLARRLRAVSRAAA